MPYASVRELPAYVKELSPTKQRQWMHVFNSSFAAHGNEQRAFASANSVVNKADFDAQGNRIVKADSQRLVYCVVLEPDTVDAQNDMVDAVEIEKAAHDYMLAHRTIGNMHANVAEAAPVESFIAPVDMTINGETIRKGSWVIGIKIFDDALWQAYLDGEYTGVSIGGSAERIPESA